MTPVPRYWRVVLRVSDRGYDNRYGDNDYRHKYRPAEEITEELLGHGIASELSPGLEIDAAQAEPEA